MSTIKTHPEQTRPSNPDQTTDPTTDPIADPQITPETEPETAQDTIQDMVAWADMLDDLPEPQTEAEAIDQLCLLEEIKAKIYARQLEAALKLEELRHEAEKEAGIAKGRRGNGLGAEIGLAIRQGAAAGAHLLAMAHALIREMPRAWHAMRRRGTMSEKTARAIYRQVKNVEPELRRKVDERLAERYEHLKPSTLPRIVQAELQDLDPAAAAARQQKAEESRTVEVQDGVDGMVDIIATLPGAVGQEIEQALTTRARQVINLGKHRDANGKPRSLNQLKADIMIHWLRLGASGNAGTNTDSDIDEAGLAPVKMEVLLVMDWDTFIDQSHTPAHIPGRGPVPAEIARKWILNPEAEVFVRRLLVAPKTGELISMESAARDFPAHLRKFVALRDDRCRSPFCDNPIGATDHVVAAAQGGATSAANASGLCPFCNQRKEGLGWTHELDPETGTLTVTTPTGHQFQSEATPVLPVFHAKGEADEPTKTETDAGTEAHAEANADLAASA